MTAPTTQQYPSDFDKSLAAQTILMNFQVKKWWVEWLRDPANKQGNNSLLSNLGYCCLGGLCQIFKDKHPDNKLANWEPTCHPSGKKTFLGQDEVLPKEVRDWAGLQTALGALVTITNELKEKYQLQSTFQEGRYTLVELNDAGVPFSVIADIIEAQL